MTKNEMRAMIAAKIAAVSKIQEANISEQIIANFNDFRENMSISQSIPTLGYIPLADEPQISSIWLSLERFYLPRMLAGGGMEACVVADLEQDLERGAFGVMEPKGKQHIIQPSEVELIIVPGRAFSITGQRLGRGKGYYDRFLSRSKALKVALAYDFQVVDELPVEEHDQAVDYIITQTRIIDCKTQQGA